MFLGARFLNRAWTRWATPVAPGTRRVAAVQVEAGGGGSQPADPHLPGAGAAAGMDAVGDPCGTRRAWTGRRPWFRNESAVVDAVSVGSHDIEAAVGGSGTQVAGRDVAAYADTSKRKREAEVANGGSGSWDNLHLPSLGPANAGLPAMQPTTAKPALPNITAPPALAGKRLKHLRNVVMHPLHAKLCQQELSHVIEDLAHAPLPTHALTSRAWAS
jgi:hypothetical protein